MSTVTLVLKKESGQQVYVDEYGAVAQHAPEDARVLVDRKNPFKVAATTEAVGADVTKLGADKTIPDGRITRMVTGPSRHLGPRLGLLTPS